MTVSPPEVVDETFPHVDALRAVGALAVLTTHVGFWSASYQRDGTVGALIARLDVGVALFFVLSGFLLSRGWLVRALAGRPAPATGHYLWKRALRILPVYVVTATLALALISFGIWMITTGKQPEPGPPRYPYAFGRNTETRTRATPPDEAHDR